MSRAGVTWSKNVNEISSISLEVSYELSDAPSERIEQVSFEAGYTRNLTADWNLNGGVGYRILAAAAGMPSLRRSSSRSAATSSFAPDPADNRTDGRSMLSPPVRVMTAICRSQATGALRD